MLPFNCKISSSSPWFLDKTVFAEPYSLAEFSDDKTHLLSIKLDSARLSVCIDDVHEILYIYNWREILDGMIKCNVGVKFDYFKQNISRASNKPEIEALDIT